jgi:hypothetical protein
MIYMEIEREVYKALENLPGDELNEKILHLLPPSNPIP